jgi:kelch-like protein 2/3
MKVERSCAESEQQETTGPLKKVYSSKRIVEKAFNVLDDLRREGQLCDVTIKVKDQEFLAHRVVLAATSPYFLAMFTGELSESKQDSVTIKEVEPSAIEQLISFVYTGKIEVGEENVQSLLPPANLLQLIEVRDICCDFLKDQLHPTNCLGIKAFADIHSCPDLLSEAQSFAQKHFSKVMESEEFYALTHQSVIELISSTELGILSEEDVFEAVISWTKQSQERAEYLPELLHHVRFLFLRREYLINRVCEEELIQSNPACKDFLIEALKYHLMPGSTTACAPRKRIGTPQSLLTVGGQAPKAIRSVEIYDVTNNTCHNGPELLSRRCRCGVTVLDNSVYAVGGFDGTSRIRSVERLDLETERWMQVEPMLSRRSTLGVAVLKGELYAVGGFDGNNGLDTVEKYNPGMRDDAIIVM